MKFRPEICGLIRFLVFWGDYDIILQMIDQTQNEPNEDLIKMTSHMLGIKIKLFDIKTNNYVVLTYGPENFLDEVTLVSAKPN